jgi:Mg2+-importing ATPase
MNKLQPAFWSIAANETLEQLQTTAQGLTTAEARARLTRYGANLLKPKKKSDALINSCKNFAPYRDSRIITSVL